MRGDLKLNATEVETAWQFIQWNEISVRAIPDPSSQSESSIHKPLPLRIKKQQWLGDTIDENIRY